MSPVWVLRINGSEPANFHGFWNRSLAQFFVAYTAAVTTLRRVAPHNRIAGPSMAGYSEEYYCSFLENASALGVLPDLVTVDANGVRG